MTSSTDPEVISARKHFAEILATMPEPKPNSDAEPRPSAKNSRAKSTSPRFATRDENHDGSIDHAEFVATATAKNKDSIETHFAKMDADNDGRITEDEFNQLSAAAK